MTITLLLYNLKLCFIFNSYDWFTQITDFIYTDFTVNYPDALDRLRVRLNVMLCLNRTLDLTLTCTTHGSTCKSVEKIYSK